VSGRVARFRVNVHLDGKSEATVELVEHAGGGDYTVSVRPLGVRREYTGLLSEVAGIVAARHVKALLAQQGVNVPKARKRR
jgi:hypothetical protein